ncbi:NEAT domain-containing protein [Lachnospiraceae bacterium 54-53]
MLKKLYGPGIIRRCMAFLLCMAVSVTSPLSSAAAGVASGSYASVNEGESDGSWIIKTEEYLNWTSTDEDPVLYTGTGARFQVDDNALVTRKDGSYHIRLGFSSYSIYDMIQIVNPEKSADMLAWCSENGMSAKLLPFGTFNAPTSAEEYKYPDNYETFTARIKEEVNQYYWTEGEVSITCRDTDMDWGVIEFELSDLSEYVMINPCYSARTSLGSIIIGFDETRMTEIPESLTYDEGEYSMGFEWSDYALGVVTVGNRSDTPTVLDLLNGIFDETVAVTIDGEGKLSAVFSVNQEIFGADKGDDQITSIGLGESRDTDVLSASNQTTGLYTALQNETNGTVFREFDISSDNTVTIPFEDMLDGQLIRISTAGTDSFNAKKTKLNQYKYYWGRLYLTKEIGNIEDVTVTAANGVVLKTDTSTLKEGYEFVSETTKEASEMVQQQVVDSIMAYSADDDSYSIWSYRIEDGAGNRVEPQSSLTVDIPVPEEYNIDTTLFYYQPGTSSSGGLYGLPHGVNGTGEIVKNDEGKWVVRLTPASYNKYDYILIIYDSGTAMTSEELSGLEKGKYYQVRPALRNLSYNDRPSMSAALLSERKGILHVTDDGKYELYMTLQGIQVGDYCYLSRMYVTSADVRKTQADILSYKSTSSIRDVEWELLLESDPDRVRSEEDLNIDNFTNEFKLHYPHTVRLPLGNMDANDEWELSFVVPAMNAVTDKNNITTGEKQAGLKLIGGATEISETECPEYDNSLLLGTIEDAGWYYDTMSEGDEKTDLLSGISDAQTAYDSLKSSPDTEKLLTAVANLKAALAAAGGVDEEVRLLSDGSYSIPFNIYKVNNSNEISEEVSPYAANFESAKLRVEGDSMTVSLTAKEAGGVTVTGLQYSGDSQSLETAEPVYGDGGELEGYTFTREYEEEPFRLQMTVSSLSYSVRVFLDMDFESAVKITASDAEKAQLTSLIEELEAILAKEDSTALYTASSIEVLQTAVNTARQVIDISDSLESGTVQTQISSLTEAKEGLRLKSEVRNLLEQNLSEARSLLLETGKYTEDTLKALSDVAEEADEIYSSYDGSDESIAKAEKTIESLKEAMEGLTLLNQGELKNLLKELEALDQKDYTEDSWEALSQAIAAAEEADGNGEVSDEELAEALEALRNARDGLVYQIYQDLGDLIDECGELKEEDYSESAWKTFSEVLEKAKDAYQESSREEMETVYEELEEALEILKTAKDSEFMKELRELVTQLEEQYSSDDYEDSSREAFEASLAAAKELLNTGRGYAVTDAQVDAQIAALQAEFDALILEAALFDFLSAMGEVAGSPALASISRKTVHIVMAAATPSEATEVIESETAEQETKTAAYKLSTAKTAVENSLGIDDGIYAIDYILWQFAADKVSMGNPALVDAYPDIDGKQAKLEVEDGKAYLYLEFQKMTFNNQTGHLLEMFIMDNLKMDSSGEIIESYTKLKPTVVEYTEETDAYGPPKGEKYPKLLKFNITEFAEDSEDYIPVMVNVPVMGASAEQPAYILVDYGSLNLLEGEEDDDTEEPGKEELDFTDFTKAVNAAAKINENKYTQVSYEALEKSIEAADALEEYTNEYDISQDMIDARTKAVNATVEALVLIKDSDGDDSGTGTTDKKALNSLLLKVAGYDKASYTSESYSNLMTAYENGLKVYEDEEATSIEITRAINSLEKAIGSLKSASQVKKTKLLAVISTAKGLTESNFTVASWAVLTMNLVIARDVYEDADASQEEVDSAQKDLQEAIKALAEKTSADSDSDSDDNSSSGSDEDDGYYKVNVRLWHASMNKASMGDNAVVNKAYVHIEDGNVTMRLVTRKMTVSGITAHLHDFWIYDGGDYETADLVSTENNKWIFEFDLPNDTSQYYKCKVDPQVDVMGDDPVKARLKVTWSSLKEVDEDDWDELTGDVDDDDDDDDTTTSSGSSLSELVSSETGIRINGNAGGPGIILEASKRDSGADYDKANETLKDIANQFVLYDIKLKSGTSYVQPSSAVTIRIPIPAGYDSGKLRLYRINDEGLREEISGKVNGSYFEAKVDHFSLYALVESNQLTAEVSADMEKSSSQTAGSALKTGSSVGASKKAKVTSKTGSANGSISGQAVNGRVIPYTGDTTPVKEVMGIGLFAGLVCIGTMLPGKRRRENEEK